jgi:hypothetical protein
VDKYILDDDGQAIACDDLLTWGRFLDTCRNKFHKTTEIAGGRVSTIFLGLDHNFANAGSPLLWETMVFGIPEFEERQWRYTDKEEAYKGHERVVDLVTNGETDEEGD